MTDLTLTAPEDASQPREISPDEEAVEAIVDEIDETLLVEGEIEREDISQFIHNVRYVFEAFGVPEDERDAYVEVATRRAYEDVIDETIDYLGECEW